MLFIQNPYYSTLARFVGERNLLNNQLVSFKTEYKSYDKKYGGTHLFRVWDINTNAVSKNGQGIIVREFKYNGSLDFAVDEVLKTIYIYKLPTLSYKGQELTICTSDVLNVLSEVSSKHIDAKDFNLKFINPPLVAAIDKKAEEIFNNIEKLAPYRNLQGIIEKINLEEQRIAQEVKEYKAKLDSKEEKYENALSKKRKIFGLDPNNFQNTEEQEKAIQERVREVYTKRLDNAKRHLEASTKKYLDLLSTHSRFYDVEGGSAFGYYQQFNEFNEGFKYGDDEVMPYEEYVSRIIDYELKYGVVPAIKEAHEDYDDYVANKRDGFFIADDFYELIRREVKPFRYQSLIFEFRGKEYQNGIDLIWQISELKKQVESCEKILKSPENQLLQSFSQENGNWGTIMAQPAFIRFGREDHKSKRNFDRIFYHLVMIRSDETNIDFSKVKRYTRKQGYEFGKNISERQAMLAELNTKNWQTDKDRTRVVCCLPSSLDYKQLIKIVTETIKKTDGAILVTDTPSRGVEIKQIVYWQLVRFINEIKQEWEVKQEQIKGEEDYSIHYWSDDTKQSELNKFMINHLHAIKNENSLIGVVVDKNYYKNFFVQTPNNKNLYFRYVKQEGKIKNIGEEFFDLFDKELIKNKLVDSIPYFYVTDEKTRYQNLLPLFSKINWQKLDRDYLGDYASHVNREQQMLEELEMNIPPEPSFVEPDYDADLSKLFTFKEEASHEEYLKALEFGLIEPPEIEQL